MFDMKCAMFLCLSFYILGANAGDLSFIDPCHWNDAECILKSSKKVLPHVLPGIPDIGLPSLDPLYIKKVNGDSSELNLNFADLTIVGLAKCELIKVERPEKLKAEIELECPVTATGKYTVKGKLFVVEVFGNGDCKISTDKIKIFATIILNEYERDGEKYYKFASFDYKYEPVARVNYELKNLYDGDEAKAEPINAILHESWKEILNEVGKPVIRELCTHVVNAVGKLFYAVPANKLELD